MSIREKIHVNCKKKDSYGNCKETAARVKLSQITLGFKSLAKEKFEQKNSRHTLSKKRLKLACQVLGFEQKKINTLR